MKAPCGAALSLALLAVGGCAGHAESRALLPLAIELAGLSRGTTFDAIDVLGEAAIFGSLEVTLLDGFAPMLGDVFDVLSAEGGVVGGFSSAVLPDLGPLLRFDVVHTPEGVLLAVVPTLAGDYNADGAVDAADYTVWRDTLGSSGVGLPADGNGDLVIDRNDHAVWATNYGAIAPAASAAASSATRSHQRHSRKR